MAPCVLSAAFAASACAPTSASAPAMTAGAYQGPHVLQPPSPKYYDLFGRTVAVSGDHLAVTSGHELGRVHVFRRSRRDTWQEQLVVAAPAGARGFGRILALARNTLVVGCDDLSAFVYSVGSATPVARLNVGGQQIDGIAASDDTIVLSARRGYPRVWTRLRGQWQMLQELNPPELTEASLGGGAALHGDLLAFGAMLHTENAYEQGAVVLYRLLGGQWTFEQLVTASNANQHDFLGTTVAVFGGVMAATVEQGRGRAYVYLRPEGGRWHQAAELVAPPHAHPMHFASVSLPDERTLIHSGSTTGTYVYRRAQTEVWSLAQSLPKSDAGWRISSSGSLLAVPSANSTAGGQQLAGSVFLFER